LQGAAWLSQRTFRKEVAAGGERPIYQLRRTLPGPFMQENEVNLSLATLRQGGCRVTVDWPRAQRTHLSFATEEEAQRWMQRDSAKWIAGHRKNKQAARG
jgi:hypothetical protein